MVIQAQRPDPRTGEIYQHYKGDLYRVLAVAQHSESGEYLVIYRRAGAHEDVHAWARPLHMWKEKVEVWIDGILTMQYRFSLVDRDAYQPREHDQIS